MVKSLKERLDVFDPVVIATAQHSQMLDQVLTLFQITPDVDLHLMRPDQNLAELTGRVLQALTPTLKELKPEPVMA